MSLKKTTIILLPDGVDRVRQFRIRRYLLVFLILLVFSYVGFFAHFLWDYINIKTKMPLLTRLIQENEKQKMQFVDLAEQIDTMNQEIEDLQDIDPRVGSVLNLKTTGDNRPLPGIGGSDEDPAESDFLMAIDRSALIRSLHRSLDSLNKELTLMKRDMSRIYEFLKIRIQRLRTSTPSIWPVKGRLSSRFGYRRSPFTGKREFHAGIDIAAERNSPVIAPADGVVETVGRTRLSGRVLTIKHENGLITKYAHLQLIIVKKGHHVKRGEKVALVGSSGRTTGPHLHYEIHLDGVPVNPLKYLPDET